MLKQNPEISVIIPVYNAGKFFERCIESIINQTLKNIEIIIIDDKSTINNEEMYDKYKNKDERIQVILKNKNEGAGITRNLGIDLAKGKYISFIDSDDYIDKDFLEKMLENAYKNHSDMVVASLVFEDINGNQKIKQYPKYKNNIFKGKNEVNEYLLNMIPNKSLKYSFGIGLPKSICNLEIIKENKLYFPSERVYSSEDYLFLLDFIPKCKNISIEKSVKYHYCNNGEKSVSRGYDSNGMNKLVNMYKVLLEKSKELGILEMYHEAIKRYFMTFVRKYILQEKNNDSKENAITNISNICNNKLVVDIVNSRYKKTLKQKIFDALIKHKKTKLLYYTIKR